MASDEIPQWVKTRIMALCNEVKPGWLDEADDLNPTFPSVAAFARYIAEHEEPPVDPDLIEARKLVAGKYQSIRDHDYAGWVNSGQKDDSSEVRLILSAIKRGRELERGE